MDEKKPILEKIKILVSHANQFKGMEFRMALEKLVKEGETAAEELMVSYLNDATLHPNLRMEIIRVAGYLRCPSFLYALKKVIETSQQSRIQQEAIISVSKFNDRSALNILNQTLQKIKNPMLLSTINTEISRIKENNPILALMPRFLEGEKNPKAFKIALDILKRILTPENTSVFTKFLDSQDPLIQRGAFEILCVAGDIFHDTEILGFYETRFAEIPCIKEPECDDLYLLTDYLKHYLVRYQFLMDEQLPNISEKYVIVQDIRVKQLLLSMVCKIKKEEIIPFIENVYNQDKKLRPTIIEELAGNEIALPFLFSLFKTEEVLKEAVIQTLLSIPEGLHHFVENFFSLPYEDQEIIVRRLPFDHQSNLVELLKKILSADIYRLKELVLLKVKEHYEFSVKDLLFAPEREREFSFMGQEYYNTISQLFPVVTVKHLLKAITADDVATSKVKKFLQVIGKIVPHELIFTFQDKEFIGKLFSKIIKANNLELSLLFLSIIKDIKTMDIETYRALNEAIGFFISKRETHITPQEKGELRRIKNSFHDLYLEFKRIEEGASALNRLVHNAEIDLFTIEQAIIEHRMAMVKRNQPVIDYLGKMFTLSTQDSIGNWLRFFTRFPYIAQLMAPYIHEKAIHGETGVSQQLQQLSSLYDAPKPRLILNFKQRHFLAILSETLAEAEPDFPILCNESQLNETDILLCDPDQLRELLQPGQTLPSRLYLFLDHLEGFNEFRAYNPRIFIAPYSFYRIIKEILQNVYLDSKPAQNTELPENNNID